MHILHILDHSLPLQSGYTFRTRSILKHQRLLGWETAHITGNRQNSGKRTEETVDDLLFYRTPPARGFAATLPGLKQVAAIQALAKRLEQVARMIKPDFLHAHSPALNGAAALWVGRRLKIPVVYEIRAFWEDAAVSHGTSRAWGPRYRLTRALETFVVQRADRVTVICEGLRQEILGRGIPADKVTVIPNAVDGAAFRNTGNAPTEQPLPPPPAKLEDRIILGFIGSFYAYEGLHILISALPAILEKNPRVSILLVGGGPEETALRQQVTVAGLSERVHFTGRIPHQRVKNWYERVDLFVYPRLPIRLTELVTPLKPLEAMASGTPVAASDIGGHRELIRDGETGYLFKAGDAGALAATVDRLLKDPEDRTRVCNNARTFVERERNWPASIANYRQVYRRPGTGSREQTTTGGFS